MKTLRHTSEHRGPHCRKPEISPAPEALPHPHPEQNGNYKDKWCILNNCKGKSRLFIEDIYNSLSQIKQNIVYRYKIV